MSMCSVQSIQPSHTRLVTSDYFICLNLFAELELIWLINATSRRATGFKQTIQVFLSTSDRENINRFELTIPKTLQYYKQWQFQNMLLQHQNSILHSLVNVCCFNEYLRFFDRFETSCSYFILLTVLSSLDQFVILCIVYFRLTH